jgi:hypothetical protein
MPSNFCLLPQYAEELARKIDAGELGLDTLSRMSSADRRAAFADIMGETNAERVNAAFESKLLLENQKKGLETWIRQTTKGKPEVARDLLARVQRMDRVLESNDPFLEDLAKQRLGFTVTQEEAGRIVELSKAVSDAEAAIEHGGDPQDYGRAKVAFSNYVSDLKNGDQSLRAQLSDVAKSPIKIAGLSKSVKASLDNSAIFRQGWRTMFSDPGTWLKNSALSFKDFYQATKGHEPLDAVMADVLSRPNARNGNYRKARLAIGNIEDQFPSSLPEKIPGLGRLFKASEAAYNGFLYRTRADIFDKYVEIAKASGEMDDPKQLEALGNVVNALTGRGRLGKLDNAGDVVNAGFFSLRKLKSDVDFLTAHQLPEKFSGPSTQLSRELAARNLVQTAVGMAAILATAHAIRPDAVELDPRSSDFGKIKVGDTRFDMSGGMASLLTFAARLATMKSKSTTTHVVSELNSGRFGGKTGLDVVHDFFENKLSPAASIIRDYLKGQDRQGSEPTAGSVAVNLIEPLPITNARELWNDPKSANLFIAMLADALGIATNTYDGKPKPRTP